MNTESNEIRLPNALRWFLAQRLLSFTPWHFSNEQSGYSFASEVFHREDLKKRKVFVFARRQDCDDFAGIEIVDGILIDKVICFHPSFGTNIPGWDIVDGEHEDVFEFVIKVVVPDMKDWASVEDADAIQDDYVSKG
ncbi:MAG: hypothetical protein IPK50_16525 [Fibrobacterota bacterium]|nr:MAG: hypothetical protein IPK50_16525 [Fibrobacterota bacterium]